MVYLCYKSKDMKNINESTKRELLVGQEKFGRIFSFVDYGNVNYWYDKDRRGVDDVELPKNRKLIVILGQFGPAC